MMEMILAQHELAVSGLDQHASGTIADSVPAVPVTLDSAQLKMGTCIASRESFEVEQVKNIKERVPDWDDDEVEELMVVSPKPKPRVLSMISEATEQPGDSEQGERYALASSDFDIAGPFPGIKGEVVVVRRKGTLDLFFMKAHPKTMLGVGESPLARRARAELEFLRAVTHHDLAFATKLHWSFQDISAFFLVTTFCPGGDLRVYVEQSGALSPDMARLYAAELVEGIDALHELGIVHRDMRPDAVLIGADGHLLISNFEQAQYVGDNGSCAPCNAQEPANPATAMHERSVENYGPHHAPEILLGWAHEYGVDWWGLGVVLFWMLTAEYPFCGRGNVNTMHPELLRGWILHGGAAADLLSAVDPVTLDLISRCLERNPLFRLDSTCAREHPYFENVNWEQVREKGLPVPPAPDLHHEIINEATGPRVGLYYAQMVEDSVDENFVSYTWELDSVGVGASESQLGDSEGLCPTIPEEDTGTSASGTTDMELESGSQPRTQSAASPVPTITELDGAEYVTIPEEFGGLPVSSLENGVVERKTRSGTLRKYASLNFDEEHKTDTLPSARSFVRTNSSGASAGALANIPIKLRKSQSAYTSPVSLNTDVMNSPRSRNKLRKKTRPNSTPTPVITPTPPLALPDGIEQIGNGIGYTRRAQPAGYSRLSFSTLTPRTCHGLFAGGASRHLKKTLSASASASASASTGIAALASANGSEDQMDAVMREMYGSTWALGMSAHELSAAAADPRAYAAEARPGVGVGVGLGWSEGTLRPGTRRAGPPEELAALSSTLRLVSPSTPRLEFY